MKVALDATPLSVPTGGIRRYVAELSRALAQTFPDDQFALISDQPFAPVAGLECGGSPRNWLERRWWLWGVARELERRGVAVFHGTDFAVPYVPLRPSVLTLHDLSPWMDSEWHHAAERVRRRAPFLLGLGIATMVIVPSEAVRRAAMDRFHIHPSRIVAIPHGASSEFHPCECPRQGTPYLLYVGTLEPRKNVALLLEVWRKLRQRHEVELVLAGRRRADFPELEAEPGLRLLGQVADEELPALYSGAAAFVYPSHYEGFGLPVLEAMQCGAPVVASQDAAIREVAGNAAVLVSIRDAKAWVDVLRALLTQDEWRSEQREKSLRRAAEFSWSRTARLTREVYEEARRCIL